MSCRASPISASAEEFLKETVPEVKIGVAHGQMAPTRLEDIMTAFYDGKIDVLVSTKIVESGLDIPTANTLIVHRADMFGLAQLYQLRGRIGRSKQRAYAYLTVPADRKLTDNAERRLKVLQSLDTLGAGFSLASHDLDIRGAGNLLGDEQSGQVREVGIELYQTCWRRRSRRLRGTVAREADEAWSPQINLGAAVLIPEAYVADLNVRMALYRRLVGARGHDGDRSLRRRADRPLRPAAGRGQAPAQDRRDQASLPHGAGRKDRRRPEGRHDRFRNNAFPKPRSSSAGSPRIARPRRCGPIRRSSSCATGRRRKSGWSGRSRCWGSWRNSPLNSRARRRSGGMSRRWPPRPHWAPRESPRLECERRLAGIAPPA